MSFLSYKYLGYIGYDKKTNLYSYKYEITDSEWVGVGVGVGVGGGVAGAPAGGVGVAAGVAIINAYEKRELPVATNLFLALQYIAKQYGWTIDEIVRLNKQYNKKYPKYEQEVQKYLMLI